MIEIKQVKEWTEKDNSNGIRIYCGNVHLGTAYPDRRKQIEKGEELFRFVKMFEFIFVPAEFLSLEEIKTHIELSIKEFLKKILR